MRCGSLLSISNKRSRFFGAILRANGSVVKCVHLRLKNQKGRTFSSSFFSSLLLKQDTKMSPSSTTDAIEHVYDFTSDTATIPTDEMFDIMKMASRGDDVFAVRANIQ